jgi:hypothetical protein
MRLLLTPLAHIRGNDQVIPQERVGGFEGKGYILGAKGEAGTHDK